MWEYGIQCHSIHNVTILCYKVMQMMKKKKAGVLKLMTLLFPLDDSTFTHRATWFRWVWQCKKAIMPMNLYDASRCRPGKVPGRLCGSPQTPPHLRKHSEVVALSWEARCQAPGIKMALSSSTGSTGHLSVKEGDGQLCAQLGEWPLIRLDGHDCPLDTKPLITDK